MEVTCEQVWCNCNENTPL